MPRSRAAPTITPVRPDAEPQDEGETNGLAIASLVIGIFWIFGLGSIAALVLGWRSLRQIRDSAGAQGGRTIAIAGIAVALAGLAGTALLIGFVISASQPSHG